MLEPFAGLDQQHRILGCSLISFKVVISQRSLRTNDGIVSTINCNGLQWGLESGRLGSADHQGPLSVVNSRTAQSKNISVKLNCCIDSSIAARNFPIHSPPSNGTHGSSIFDFRSLEPQNSSDAKSICAAILRIIPCTCLDKPLPN